MEGMESQFTMLGMWGAMTWLGKTVVIVLALMSIWSLSLAIERLIRFRRAKKQSLQVALGVTPLLKQHKLDEAITFAKDKKYRHSHLARVLTAGLTEFQYEKSQTLPEDFDVVESGKRAIERETLMTTAEMKKGLGNLATIPPRRRSSVCSERSSESSMRSREWPSPDRAVLGPFRQASRKHWLRPRSDCLWPSPQSGCTTTSRTRSSDSR